MQEEAEYLDEFRDVAALIWYLRFVPWQVPDFTTSRYRQVLAKIHDGIDRTGAFPVSAHRLLVIAQRPA